MRVYVPVLRRPRIEMIPLIDTFFLLLAFFISSVLTMEVVGGLPVELPRSIGASKLPQTDRWVVTLGPEGVLQLEGSPVSLEELSQRLQIHPRREALRVGIRADRATPYPWLIQALEAVRGSGVGKVTLMTQPEGKR